MKTQKKMHAAIKWLKKPGGLFYVALLLWVILMWLLSKPLITKTTPHLRLPHISWFKRKPPVEIVQEIKIYTPEEFVLFVSEMADAEIISLPTTIPLNENDSVKGTDCREATIKPFPTIWEFTELLPVLKEFELTVQDEVSLVVSNYESFILHYKPGDEFHVWGPKYIEYFDECFDGKIYLVNQSGKLWCRRK